MACKFDGCMKPCLHGCQSPIHKIVTYLHVYTYKIIDWRVNCDLAIAIPLLLNLFTVMILFNFNHIHVYTILTFNNHLEESYWEHSGKRIKWWLPGFPPFLTIFSILPNKNFDLLITFILMSSNFLKFDFSVLFGKELKWKSFLFITTQSRLLTHYQTTNFRLFQTERVCRRQFQIWRKWQKDIQTGRKHCGKRRNCLLRAISPFPTVFSKGLFPRGVKRCHCVGMG